MTAHELGLKLLSFPQQTIVYVLNLEGNSEPVKFKFDDDGIIILRGDSFKNEMMKKGKSFLIEKSHL
jgi:hypothetical protein